MKDHPNLYILTYDHGGFVLWKDKVETTLREHIGWNSIPVLNSGLTMKRLHSTSCPKRTRKSWI